MGLIRIYFGLGTFCLSICSLALGISFLFFPAASAYGEIAPQPLQVYGLGLVQSVAYSHDGNHLLLGAAGNAYLYNADTGTRERVFTGRTGTITSVAFSLDGIHVITGSQDYTARLWDIATGAELRSFTGHTGDVTSVAFSVDGAQVLTGSRDETARLWDATTGAVVRTFAGHTNDVTSAAFSPDGSQVLTGSQDNTARLWDVATGEVLRTFSGHTNDVFSVAFSPNGTQVLTGSQDHTAKLWDTATGEVLRTFSGHTNDVFSVAFSPNGTQVLTGSKNNVATLWDSATGTVIQTFIGHELEVNSVAFSPDGKKVLTGSHDGTARLWDRDTGEELRTFTGHSSEVHSVAFSPNEAQVLTGSWDDRARLWDEATGDLLQTFTGVGVLAAYSPDGTKVLTGSYNVGAMLRDAATGEELLRFVGHTNDVTSIAFSPDGTRVLTGSDDYTAKLWDAATGAVLRTFTGNVWAAWEVTSVAFSPDGTKVLVGTGSDDGLNGTARLWDAATGEELQTFTEQGEYVTSVAFSPDGTKVLTWAGLYNDDLERIYGKATLWDAATGEELRTFAGHTNWVYSVAFSPDGTKVLTGEVLWDATSGAIIEIFTGHTGRVLSVAFSPDGTKVLTGAGDSTARLWACCQFAPDIMSQPMSRTIYGGEPVTLEVEANGTPPLVYQWRRNGVNIEAATASSFNIASTHPSDAGAYDCVVTNAFGSVTSNAAILSLMEPRITNQPRSWTVYPGDGVSFSLSATGGSQIAYQWRLNGSAISGANTSTYSIASALPFDVGTYECTVSNPAGSVTSDAVGLIELGPAITEQPLSRSVYFGDSVSFFLSATGGSLVTYQWRLDGNAISSANAATYSISSAQAADAGVYDCVVSNPVGSVTSDSAVLSVDLPPVAQDDEYSVKRGESKTVAAPGVLGNDSDVEGSPMTAAVVSLPTHGTITLNGNGAFTYSHDGSETDTDSFTYNASDFCASSNVATVTLHIIDGKGGCFGSRAAPILPQASDVFLGALSALILFALSRIYRQG